MVSRPVAVSGTMGVITAGIVWYIHYSQVSLIGPDPPAAHFCPQHNALAVIDEKKVLFRSPPFSNLSPAKGDGVISRRARLPRLSYACILLLQPVCKRNTAAQCG
jgi:hypothetical protein